MKQTILETLWLNLNINDKDRNITVIIAHSHICVYYFADVAEGLIYLVYLCFPSPKKPLV